MTWRFVRRARMAPAQVVYYLTFRMLTGVGRTQAHSQEELNRMMGDLRLAGASDITVVDGEGRLVSFDPGSE